jgi:glycosyltransferase involved in cell wall biosynthesis
LFLTYFVNRIFKNILNAKTNKYTSEGIGYNLLNYLGIIIPVYNEGENIGKTIEAIEQNISTPHKIYLVYDFDEDNTLPAAYSYTSNANLIFLKNELGGVLNAIKTGFKKTTEEVLLVTMADLSDDYSVVDKMHDLLVGGFDIVCGSRYMPGGKQIGGPCIKKFLSKLAGVSLKYLAFLPTHDVTNSFKLYKRKVINSISVESTGGFEIGMEIVIKAHFNGYKVTEFPCIWQDRSDGFSRFKLVKWLPKYLKWYLYALKKRLLEIVKF